MYSTDQEQMQEDSRECEAMRKMFVGGLNRETSEDEFFDYFGSYGNMVDKVIIKDPETKTSRGFGFITYDSSDCVEAVFKARPHNLGGKTLDVKRAMPRDYNTSVAHSKVTKLFIGGVSPDLTPEDLQIYIESRHPTSIGTVDKIDFLKDKDTDKNKGFGFLECSDTDFADRLTISEKQFQLKGKSMSLKKAEPRSGEGGAPGGRGGGRGGGGRGYGGRGRGGGRGGGRGRGGGYNNQSYDQGGYENQNNYNDYSTGYPSYNNSNNGGYNNYNQGYGQQQGGGYGDNYQSGYQNTGYGVANQRGSSRGGNWNSGGGNRYNPY